jgi:hypothetical protein
MVCAPPKSRRPCVSTMRSARPGPNGTFVYSNVSEGLGVTGPIAPAVEGASPAPRAPVRKLLVVSISSNVLFFSSQAIAQMDGAPGVACGEVTRKQLVVGLFISCTRKRSHRGQRCITHLLWLQFLFMKRTHVCALCPQQKLLRLE